MKQTRITVRRNFNLVAFVGVLLSFSPNHGSVVDSRCLRCFVNGKYARKNPLNFFCCNCWRQAWKRRRVSVGLQCLLFFSTDSTLLG
ncbi:hypothetical protein PISMIDRAFT_347133 [Pisolithus microcarpus 441]|uniref:Secreted protein n=1 Tax=Pisolithus microcarpus 441 TaxID=765257 RepID=A0A0C9XQS1_9AGAM|nr:hypothetical protein BKA83DRAFT_347133 [Pisolithus microcarpus]KIK14620.1 hypothetical protein PISMIDRAFT_347133 [Pisolithus microcarpus 441]